MTTDRITKADERFLRAIGVAVDEPSFFEQRMELAKRIARHTAPAQVHLDPQAAQLQLIRLATRKIMAAAQTDCTLRLMTERQIPITRHNYLVLAFAGNPPLEPLPAEIEAELPWFLREDNR